MVGKEMNIFQNVNTSQSSSPTDLKAGILTIDNLDLIFSIQLKEYSTSLSRQELLDNKCSIYLRLRRMTVSYLDTLCLLEKTLRQFNSANIDDTATSHWAPCFEPYNERGL